MLAQSVGAGATAFQRPDGKFIVLMGNNSTGVNIYDAGWYPDGQYMSEQIQVPALAANTTLDWKKGPDNFVSMEVRTATSQANLATSSFRTIGNPGTSIYNAGGETWAQVVINFRRDFPVFDGALNGAVNGSVAGSVGAGGRAYSYRQISLPTIYEFKLGSGSDLLNLQSGGQSMLRVTSNGNVYSSSVGGFFSGGADLAENYTSTDALEPGEVVMSDPGRPQAVKRSYGQYHPGILGVVSTAPGFVAGAYTEDSFPIGLIGRVPVKVSTENGAIRAGDPLTSASIPGYAMKATKAGRVLGRALEPFDESLAVPCPAFGMGGNPSTKCGSVMMFVNLIDYNGQSIEEAFTDWKFERAETQAALLTEGEVALQPIELGGVVFETHEAELLAFLELLKSERSDAEPLSEIFTDRLSAIVEIMTPSVITNAIRSRALTTDTITGTSAGSLTMSLEGGRLVIRAASAVPELSLGTTTALAAAISAFSDDGASTTDATASTTPVVAEAPVVLPDAIVVSFDAIGNAYFKGEVVAEKVTAGALSVSGIATFAGGLEVAELGSASTTISVLSDSIFFGRPYFTSDTGGTATIKKGAREVEIAFDKEYIETPIVSATLAFGTTTDDTLIEAVLSEGIAYAVIKRDVSGFTIRLGKAAPENMTFNWIALAVKDSKVFTSRTIEPQVVEEVPETATETGPESNGETQTGEEVTLPEDAPTVETPSDTEEPAEPESSQTPQEGGGDNSAVPTPENGNVVPAPSEAN